MRADERGVVTAETAAVLPLLAAVTLAMVWLISVGVAQVQVTDAAREAARAAARGESGTAAAQLAVRAAPGSAVSLAEDGGRVTARVSDRVEPFGLLAGLGAVEVSAEATALVEAG
jgi:Flp pilus assembly protein TadG